MPRESSFEASVIEEIERLFPGAIVLKNYPNYLQGFPDRLILFGNKWAAFEVKASKFSSHRPNQDYYIDLLNDMSYAAFIYPRNKETVLDELQQALRLRRGTRVLGR